MPITNETLLHAASSAIALALEGRSKLPPEILSIEGMSSQRNRHLLNTLCSFDGCRYLEIGCWRGSTYISALYKNLARIRVHAAVDNFTESPDGTRAALEAACTEHLGPGVLRLIEADIFHAALPNDICDINVLFYDGAHDRASQSRFLPLLLPLLSPSFILIADDWCWGHVRDETLASIRRLPLTPLLESQLSVRGFDPPQDTQPVPLNPLTGYPAGHSFLIQPDGWYNGMFVGVYQKRQ